DETNLTGPVGGRMVDGIVAGGQKSEMASKLFSGEPVVGGDWRGAAKLRRGTGRLCRSVGWVDSCRSNAAAPPVVHGRERERDRGGGEREEREKEKGQGTWPCLIRL
ncbi:hypothetical protein PanWU01x14_097580, partial [Parasponia andersonii]